MSACSICSRWLPLVLWGGAICAADNVRPLPDTRPLVEEPDRSARMVEGISRWLHRETAQVAERRFERWKTAAAGSGWAQFRALRREQLRTMLGMVDPVVSGSFENVTLTPPDRNSRRREAFSVQHVRWPVLPGVHGEGVLFWPADKPRATLIALPDADQTPEEFILARNLAAQGVLVLVPTLVDRRNRWSGNEAAGRFTNQPHREWIYRQAFEMGRTVIGFEAQKVLAAVDALRAMAPHSAIRKLEITDPPAGNDLRPAEPASPLGLIGYGEGALLALHCAALDERFRATLVSGYFAPREQLFEEPIYRNVFGRLREFGDAELAALIAPRALIVEYSGAPEITGPPAPGKGRTGAAPGKISTTELGAVSSEVDRANAIIAQADGLPRVVLIKGADGKPLRPGSSDTQGALLAALGVERQTSDPGAGTVQAVSQEQIDARQQRAVRELEQFTQQLVAEAERKRNAAVWAQTKPGAEWDATQRALRRRLSEEVIGRIDGELLPPNPRTRFIRESATWTGYEVVLDVLPDVFAWGWLLVPKDLKPGERRPVVVCQHGLEGLPEDVVNEDPKSSAYGPYKAFAARLAARGFIVFAPHNPYRGKDQFRMLQRQANPLGLSLFSFIVAQHDALTRWLETLPLVDRSRIGFYGLSYGGKTAMRIPALIERYSLSICSADYNEWVRKNVLTDATFSYMFTGEWEMPEWNLAHVANYAEMAMLIAPRPFMVERGHDDAVAVDEWVGYEYAKVRRGYVKLGIGERTEIEWFDGPHTINGQGTFQFLARHLRWPPPPGPR